MEGLGIMQIPIAVGVMQVPSMVQAAMQNKQAHDMEMMVKQKEMEANAKFFDNMSKEISTW